jgi:hypothetical protein
MLPRFSVASTERRRDAGSPGNGVYRGDQDAAARSVIAGEKQGCIAGRGGR